MRVLYRGLEGDDVSEWQDFLRGRDVYSNVVVSGRFDDATFVETRQFQSDAGFVGHDVDGVVGRFTLAEALKCGFKAIDDDRDGEDGPNWPPVPNFSALTAQECEAIFGRFTYVPAPSRGNPEAIRIISNWAAENIVTVHFPEKIGNVSSGQFHKKIAGQVEGLFGAWHGAGLWNKLLTFDGAWAPRFVRGSRTNLSNHSHGCAFDVNYAWNQLGCVPALKGAMGSVRELVGIANDHGVFWGGHWGYSGGRADGTHFSVARLA